MERVTSRVMQTGRFKSILPFLLALKKYAIHALFFSFRKGLHIVHFVVLIFFVAIIFIRKDYKAVLLVQYLVVTKVTEVCYKMKDCTLLYIEFKLKMGLFKMLDY